MKAGPCPPVAKAPTRIGHIETWEVRPATGDTRRVGISDPGARLPNLVQVCLVCPARHSKGNKYYFPRVRGSKRPSMDLVCSPHRNIDWSGVWGVM